MAPPGIPKTTSTPSTSRERTSEDAPVIGVALAADGAPGSEAIDGADAGWIMAALRWGEASRVGLVMSCLGSKMGTNMGTKKARVPDARG
jgi:hypothetical protein